MIVCSLLAPAWVCTRMVASSMAAPSWVLLDPLVSAHAPRQQPHFTAHSVYALLSQLPRLLSRCRYERYILEMGSRDCVFIFVPFSAAPLPQLVGALHTLPDLLLLPMIGFRMSRAAP